MSDFWDMHGRVSQALGEMNRVLGDICTQNFDLSERDPLDFADILCRVAQGDRAAIAAEWEKLLRDCAQETQRCIHFMAAGADLSGRRKGLVTAFLDRADAGLARLVDADVETYRITNGRFQQQGWDISWLARRFFAPEMRHAFHQLDIINTRIKTRRGADGYVEAGKPDIAGFCALSESQAVQLLHHAQAQAGLARACSRVMLFVQNFDPLSEAEGNSYFRQMKDIAENAIGYGYLAANMGAGLRRNVANMKSMQRPFFMGPVF